MPSVLNSLSAAMLAALLLCASGVPVPDALIESPAGDPSGEEGETEGPSDLLSAFDGWDLAINTIARHLHELKGELPSEVKYTSQHNKIASLPEKCPKSNFSKEACLHRLVQGLRYYMVLLRHVEKEYPSSSIPSEAGHIRGSVSNLINIIKSRMESPEPATALTSSQEQQLLTDIDSPNTFRKKMAALTILHELRIFIIECKRVINKKEMNQANRGVPAVTFYQQS